MVAHLQQCTKCCAALMLKNMIAAVGLKLEALSSSNLKEKVGECVFSCNANLKLDDKLASEVAGLKLAC